MEEDAEKFCKSCKECQRVSLPDPPECMRRTELPQGQWQDLTADLMGPLPNIEDVIVVVYYYSCYFEVSAIRCVTSSVITHCLEKFSQLIDYRVQLKLTMVDSFYLRRSKPTSVKMELNIEHLTGHKQIR